MILWTMQPEEVYQQIMQNGVYICDPARMNMPEFTEMYDWLTGHMRTKIGPPPSGVVGGLEQRTGIRPRLQIQAGRYRRC